MLGSGSGLKYPTTITPQVTNFRRAPEKRSIAHFLFSQETITELMEDIPQMDGVRHMHIDSDRLDDLYLVTHWLRQLAGKKPKKMQADDLLESLNASPHFTNSITGRSSTHGGK